MSQSLINVGKYACDTTGTYGRIGFININAMFSELFTAAAIGAPQLINTGTYQPGADPTVVTVFPTIPTKPGETTLSAFTKINANFAALFASPAINQPGNQQVISLGGQVGMIVGENSPVIGTGDPIRVAGAKINNNFAYLYTII